jgi:hypothetical protein
MPPPAFTSLAALALCGLAPRSRARPAADEGSTAVPSACHRGVNPLRRQGYSPLSESEAFSYVPADDGQREETGSSAQLVTGQLARATPPACVVRRQHHHCMRGGLFVAITPLRRARARNDGCRRASERNCDLHHLSSPGRRIRQ